MILNETESHTLTNEVSYDIIRQILFHQGAHLETFASSSRRSGSGYYLWRNKQAGSKDCLYHLVAGDAGEVASWQMRRLANAGDVQQGLIRAR